MAVAFDAVGPAGGGGKNTTNGTNSSPFTWTHTPVGTPTDVLIGVSTGGGSANTVTGVTYGGVTCSLVGSWVESGLTQAAGGQALYWCSAPPAGAQTVSVSYTGTFTMIGGSISFTGGGGGLGTSVSANPTSTSSSISASVSNTTTGGMIGCVTCFGGGSGSGTFSGTNSVTVRYADVVNTISAAGNSCGGTVASTGGGASQTVGFSNTKTDNWGFIAVEVLPGTGGGGAAATHWPTRAAKARYRHHQGVWRQQAQQVFQPPVGTALTVTATNSGAAALNGLALTVKVLTGSAGFGTTAASGTVTTPQLAITPAASGSIVYGSVFMGGSSTAFTPNASTTFFVNASDATNTTTYGNFRATSTTTGGTPVTVGGSAPSVSAGNDGICLLEVKSGGSLAEDSSAPAVLSTTSSKTLTTATFTPPFGAVLVAIVSADGNGAATTGNNASTTITDTLGLSWTKQIDQTLAPAGGILQVASIWTATLPGAGVNVTAGLATSSGAALDFNQSMSIGLTLTLAAGTGAAQAVGGGLTSGLATGASAVQFAGTGLTPALATGTGVAQTVQSSIGANAGLATGVGVALDWNQGMSIGLTPALATGTGTAQTPENGLSSAAGLASGVGAANAPNLGFTPGLSSGTGAAQAVGGGLTSGLSTGTGTAQFAGTALTPGLSSGTGSSLAPAIGLTIGLATGTGAALDFNQGLSIGLTPGLATGTALALDVAQLAPPPTQVTLTTKNYTQIRHHHGMWRQQIQQVIQPPPAFTATAGLATATGAALDVNQGMSVGITVGLATGTGAALDVNQGMSVGLTPGLATGTGAAKTPGSGLGIGLASGTGNAQTPGMGLTTGLASGTGAAQAVGGGRTTGLATGTGTAQFAGTGITPGIATGTGTALVPTLNLGNRKNVDYTGSTLTNPNTLGGTVSVAALGGTLSVAANTLGGTVTVVNTLGGTVNVATLGGTLAITNYTLTGTLNVAANTLSAMEVTDKMQEVDITLNEFNDATVTFQILNNGSPDNITGMTVNALFKKTRGDLDSAGTTKTYSSAGGSPAITINTPTTGSCTLAIPDADVIFPNFTFYRIDVVNGSITTTAIFGTVTITQL